MDLFYHFANLKQSQPIDIERKLLLKIASRQTEGIAILYQELASGDIGRAASIYSAIATESYYQNINFVRLKIKERKHILNYFIHFKARY